MAIRPMASDEWRGTDDGMDIIPLTRILRSTKTDDRQKFEAAKALWSLIQSQISFGDERMDTSNDGPNNGFWSLPGLLRSHCMAAELDWAINQTLAGAKPKRGSKAIDKERKTKEVDLMAKGVAWEVLARVLHDENLLPNGYAIPSSILVGIAAQLQDSNAATDALILHVGRVLQTMCALKQQEAKGGQMSNVQMSSRLDHCVALATAALSVDSKSIGSSWEEHKVAYHAIMLLEIQIRGAINPRKVWDMVIPNHLPVFLISAFSPALTSNEPLQLACRRILRDVIFAPEHLSSLQEAFDIEPERRSAVKTASYATQLLFQMDQLLMGDESLESTEAALVSLPWFIHEFCTAYNAHTELFNKKTASLTLDGEHGEGEEGTKDESNKTKPDFNPAFRCFESFSRSLMSTWADRQTKDPKYKGEMLLRSLASACRVLSQVRGVYKPMEDVTGKRRQWLSHIVSFALQLAHKVATSSTIGFALDIIYAIVLVEHRDIQDHLSTIWSLLWKGALGPGSHVHRAPSSGSFQTSATQLAIALVHAHADLRQLEAMFDSLASSFQSIGPVYMPLQFCAACREAIASAPSAQSVSFVRMVGRWIECSGGAPLEDVSRLGCLCLSSVSCQLMTAPGIADACVQLIHALRVRLGPGMDSLTPSILSLYTEAVRLHNACCQLHPNVIPLKGQQVGQFENGVQNDRGGFFSALFSEETRDMVVWEHIRQWEVESLMAAALHLQTLHQRILRAQHDSCNPESYQTEGLDGINETLSVFDETDIEDARYLARMVIRQAGRCASRVTDKDTPCFEMVYPLYKSLDTDGVEAYALVPGCDQDVPGLPVPTRIAINLLLKDASLMEAIAFDPFRLCRNVKKLHAVAYNLVGRFIAADMDQDQEIARYRLACFPLRDEAVSIAVGRWMRLVLSSMLPVEDINGSSFVASTADKKRKREGKGETKADSWGIHRFRELCKQLTNESVEPGNCIRKELIAMLKTVAAIGSNPKWGDVLEPNTLLYHVQVADKLVSLLPRSHDVEGNAGGRLCLAVAAAGALIAVLTLKTSVGKPAEPNQLVSISAHLLCNSILLLSRGMQRIEMTGKQKALLREKGFLSALKKFVMAVGGAAFAWNLVEPIKHLVKSLFTSTLMIFDGKSHKTKTLKKLSELLVSCITSPVDALLVTACGEACLSAVIQQETNKTTFPDDLIASFVDAIDRALPASPVLHIGDTKVFESYYFSLATAAGCVLQLRCALPLPKSPTMVRLPDDFKAVAETMTLYMRGKRDQGSVGVLEQALAYVHGVCVITACMKPSASSYHFGSVLCLLMLLLHWTGHDVDPVNKIIPMTAMFPGASGEDTPGSTAELRGKALLALHTLISGATDQQVREVIRFAQNLLGGRCNGFSGLAAAELVLMTLEAYGTCREHEHDRRLHVGGDSIKSTSLRTFNHALAQRGDRMACILIRALSIVPLASAPLASAPQPRRVNHHGDTSSITAGVSYARLCTEFLQGLKGKAKSDIIDAGQRKAFEFEWAHAGVDPSSEWVGPFVPTVLRALESIVGRPKVFNDIPARTFIRLVQCLSIRLPVGECTPESASAMVASCRVLSSLLRHREEAITPCMSQVAHILGALLRWVLVDAIVFRNGPTNRILNYCSEVLGAVMVEFGSRGQRTAALCPHVLREYILAQSRTNFQAIETTAIRHGAYALYGGSGPGGIEYLYATLGSGGHASLQALAEIKAGYEAEYKYTGKV